MKRILPSLSKYFRKHILLYYLPAKNQNVRRQAVVFSCLKMPENQRIAPLAARDPPTGTFNGPVPSDESSLEVVSISDHTGTVENTLIPAGQELDEKTDTTLKSVL